MEGEIKQMLSTFAIIKERGDARSIGRLQMGVANKVLYLASHSIEDHGWGVQGDEWPFPSMPIFIPPKLWRRLRMKS